MTSMAGAPDERDPLKDRAAVQMFEVASHRKLNLKWP